jgi:hypothetical protein
MVMIRLIDIIAIVIFIAMVMVMETVTDMIMKCSCVGNR